MTELNQIVKVLKEIAVELKKIRRLMVKEDFEEREAVAKKGEEC